MTVFLGQTLAGRYRVDQYLGGGAMADVYKVWDSERACWMAIKVLRQSLTQSREFAERFRREAEALARLQHPNIVRFYGAEQHADVTFLVMDYVEGPTLASRLAMAQGPLIVSETLAVTRDVCAALTYAHRAGVVHRDIKPSNILLRRDGRAVVSDFGISRLSDAVTLTSVAIGTPAYMSPEQCQGKRVDARSDLYSFGVILFEMLSGRRPFRGEKTPYEDGSTEAVIYEHLNRDPPPRTPSLSAAFGPAVRRALAKDPAQRYQGAFELYQALDAAADAASNPTETAVAPGAVRDGGGGGPPGYPPATGPADRARRRLPLWSYIAAAFIVAGLVGAGVAAYSLQGAGHWFRGNARNEPAAVAPTSVIPRSNSGHKPNACPPPPISPPVSPPISPPVSPPISPPVSPPVCLPGSPQAGTLDSFLASRKGLAATGALASSVTLLATVGFATVLRRRERRDDLRDDED